MHDDLSHRPTYRGELLRTPTIMNALHVLLITPVLLAGCTAIPQTFTPEQPIAARTFSHRFFDTVLQAHVQDGVVQYPAIAQNTIFTEYLHQLDHIAPTQLPTPNDRLAFWINAYNAFAIKGILDGYSPKTFTGRYQYFVNQRYAVGGETINLYDLERGLLIPNFREPRIHFAIVCASHSCPKLQSWAFTGGQIDEQLTESAKQFINDPTRNHFDHQKNIAYLSKIFDWFMDDFVNHSGSLTRYVAQYVNDPNVAEALTNGQYTVQFLEYDWSLNGIAPESTNLVSQHGETRPSQPTSLNK
ncbi:MAG: DUF547 domain-containing protein [Nitrospirales bacterium]|nr:MAG: DUF547 domain-containing protein [Nitrospirales bacterium]